MEDFIWWVLGLLVFVYICFIAMLFGDDPYAAEQAKKNLVTMTAFFVFSGLSVLATVYVSPILGKAVGFLSKLF